MHRSGFLSRFVPVVPASALLLFSFMPTASAQGTWTSLTPVPSVGSGVPLVTALAVVLVLSGTAYGELLTTPPTPIRTPRESVTAGATYFNIIVSSFNLPPGAARLQRWSFPISKNWEFYNRIGYRCAAWFLQLTGNRDRVARVVLRSTEGITYLQINDKYGAELPETSAPCPLSTGRLAPPVEFEMKPVGLKDTVVTFVRTSDGAVLDRIVFPATSPFNPDTWFELDEVSPTADNITVEMYWQSEKIAVIDIDRMSAGGEMIVT